MLRGVRELNSKRKQSFVLSIRGGGEKRRGGLRKFWDSLERWGEMRRRVVLRIVPYNRQGEKRRGGREILPRKPGNAEKRTFEGRAQKCTWRGDD